MIIYMGRRLNALLEIFLVYIPILLVPIIILPTIYWLFPILKKTMILGQFTPYTFIAELTYLAIVLIAMAVTRRGLSRTGITFHNIPGDLKIAAICIITLSFLPLIFNYVIAFLPWNLIGIHTFNGPIGSIFYYITEVVALLITVKVLMKIPIKGEKIAISTFMIIPAMLLPSISGIPEFAVTLIGYFILFFVFVGPIEELVYRGYIQSRLNEVFDRPYKFFGINWGSGLIITSLLFAFVHVTNYNFNPLIGNYSLDWGWGLGVFIMGLALCFIREKTGNIVAPAIVHSAADFVSNIIRFL